jgi:hypothetical protein
MNKHLFRGNKSLLASGSKLNASHTSKHRNLVRFSRVYLHMPPLYKNRLWFLIGEGWIEAEKGPGGHETGDGWMDGSVSALGLRSVLCDSHLGGWMSGSSLCSRELRLES